jgi:hypothetical protein
MMKDGSTYTGIGLAINKKPKHVETRWYYHLKELVDYILPSQKWDETKTGYLDNGRG